MTIETRDEHGKLLGWSELSGALEKVCEHLGGMHPTTIEFQNLFNNNLDTSKAEDQQRALFCAENVIKNAVDADRQLTDAINIARRARRTADNAAYDKKSEVICMALDNEMERTSLWTQCVCSKRADSRLAAELMCVMLMHVEGIPNTQGEGFWDKLRTSVM